jgi:hypothetical protein
MRTRTIFLLVLSIFAFLSFVCFRLPSGSIVAGGDFYQLLDYQAQLSRYQYAWMHQVGQGGYNPLFVTYPFYFLLAGLNLVFSSSVIASWILFLFLSLAFFSTWYSLSWLVPGLQRDKKVFLALLYALNSFVLTIFTYTWGFTHHFLIYLAVPVLMGSFLQFISNKDFKWKEYGKVGFCFMLAIPAFNNISFFIMLLLFQGLMAGLSLLYRNVAISGVLVKKVLLLGATYAIFVIPFFYPMVVNTLNSSNRYFTNQQALGGQNYLEGWITSTSSNFKNVFSLALDDYRYPFFETSNGIFFIVAGSFYFFLLLFLLYKNQAKGQPAKADALTKVVLLTFVFASVLAVRFFGPITPLLKPLYLSPLFIFFRSSDKIFSFFPWIYVLLVGLLLQHVTIKRRLFYFLTLCLVTPFFLQVIQSFLVADYNRFFPKATPEYTYIVELPEEYKRLEVLLADERQTAVVSIPYSVKNSVNWSNYPKWHFVGHDILHLLSEKRFISANTYDHPSIENVFSFLRVAESATPAAELLPNLQKFGAEYVLFHKDIEPNLLNKARPLATAVDVLESQSTLTKIEDNDFYTLYQLAPDLVKPVFSVTEGGLEFTQVNPTLYRLRVESKSSTQLQFLETFDPSWKLYERPLSSVETCSQVFSYDEGRITECIVAERFWVTEILSLWNATPVSADHELCLEYANCWNIPGESGENLSTKEYILYYQNQNMVYLAILILAFGAVVGTFAWYLGRREGE